MKKLLRLGRVRGFLRSRSGRALVGVVAIATFASFIELDNYAFAVTVERQKVAKVREMAKKLGVDPEFLRNPGGRKPSRLEGLFASLSRSLGLEQTMAAPAPASGDVAAKIQEVKGRYALVAADAVLRSLASLLETAASRSVSAEQLQARTKEVLRLLEKELLPPVKEGLPAVAAARDQQMRSALAGLRRAAADILNVPRALDAPNLAATLDQVRNATSHLLAVRRVGTRWTRDTFPVRDTYRTAPTMSMGIPASPLSTPGASSLPGGLTKPVSEQAVEKRGTKIRTTAKASVAEVPQEVRDLAARLGTPAAIFRYVHDGIGWESYGGVAKGSLGTLREGRGNDWDQALLLRDLLLAGGWEAQLEWGTVTLSIAQAANLVGTEDPLQTANLFATAGFDAVALTGGGVPVAIRLTHAWVRAAIPYVQNRGATAGPADTWVRMDPSFKRYRYQAGIPINGRVPWSEAEYLESPSVRPPTDLYADKIWAYIRANNILCENLSQVGKAGTIVAENFPYVPATLTAKIESVAGMAPEPPTAQMQKVALSLLDSGGNAVATYTANMADLWGKKLSLTFPPATPEDAAIIAGYGGLFSTPAYLVRLKPVFSLDDQSVSEGAAVAAGAVLDWTLAFQQPNVPPDSTRHSVIAGETHVEVFDPGIVPDSLLGDRQEKLAGLIAAGASADAILSERLYAVGLRYFQHVDRGLDFATGVRWQRAVKRAFEANVSRRLDVEYNVAGAPLRLKPAESGIDVTRLLVGVVPIDNDLSNKVEALMLAGLESSYREASIWDEMESDVGISAAKALLLSRIAGQTLHRADTSNVDSVMAAVNLPVDVEAEIRGAILQGRVARLASSPITVNRWTGTGYILEDPATGSATYPISGGFAGGSSTGGDTSPISDLLGSESWLEGSPLAELLRMLLELLGGGGSGTGGSDGGPATNQSDPVNLSSGNMFRTFTDLTVVARGIPIVLSRTYNSRSSQSGPFGYGWTFSYGEALTTNPDDSVNYREADGTEHVFARNPDGTFASPAGKYLTLTSGGAGYTLRFKDGMVYGFDASGRLVSQTDLSGNAVTVNRDASGLPSSVVDASGRTVLTFAVSVGRLVEMTDLAGRRVLYGYTGEDLTSVTDTAGKVWSFAYDGSHNLIEMADPLGNRQAYSYDAEDRLFHHTDATGAEEFFHYDIAGRRSVLTDRRGGDRYIEFDDLGRATLEADPAGNVVKAAWDGQNNRTAVEDSRGFQTSYQYDSLGNLARQVNPDGGATTSTFDSNSRPLTTTDPLGSTTTNQYDSRGNLLRTTRNVSGVDEATVNTYDASGQLLTTTDPNNGVTAFAWNANGAMTSQRDALNQTTALTPDALGRMTRVQDPAGNATSIVYDAKDRITSLTDPYTNVTSFAYDDAGRRTSVTTPRGTTTFTYDGEGRVLSVRDPLGSTTSSTYDAAGNVLTRTDARGNVTRYEYDGVGRVSRIVDGNGGVWTYGWCAGIGSDGAGCSTCSGGGGESFCLLTDPNGNTIRQDFDVMGRVSVVTDALGHTMTMEYDRNGRKVGETDAAGNRRGFGYDEAGRLVSVSEASGAVTAYEYDKKGNKLSQRDANGRTWTFAYDLLNRLTSETDPLNRVTTYSYDALGNIRTKTDAKNQTLTYSYQVRRLTTITYPGGATETFSYDGMGRRTGMSNVNGSFTYTHDALNRVKTATNQRFNVTLSYDYDAAGNRTRLTTPKGEILYAYDGKNRLTQITDPVFGRFGFGYDPMDRRTSLTYPNGITTSYQYDRAYRLTALASKDTQGNVLDAWSYTYDRVGNRLSKTNKDGLAETYQYDSVYRVTRAVYATGSSEAFTYDPVGNRLTKSDGAGTDHYSYDVANQMLSAGGDMYTYDANGSVISRRTPGGALTTFTYDFQNRLAQISSPQGSETSQYAPDGTRVFVNSPAVGGAIGPVYDTIGNPILDMESAGVVGTYRLYGPGIDEPLAEWHRANAQTTFLHKDALGSVTAVSTPQGGISYRITYSAFGERNQTAPASGVVPTRLSYTARENSVGSLMQYRSRYYEASTARFSSQDGYRGLEFTPPSLHRYAYSVNNPLRYTDPSGQSPDAELHAAYGGDADALFFIVMIVPTIIALAMLLHVLILSLLRGAIAFLATLRSYVTALFNWLYLGLQFKVFWVSTLAAAARARLYAAGAAAIVNIRYEMFAGRLRPVVEAIMFAYFACRDRLMPTPGSSDVTTVMVFCTMLVLGSRILR